MSPETHTELLRLLSGLCDDRLSPEDRQLIRSRYQGSGTAELVRQSGASRRTMFRNLDRIRRQLSHCIDRRLAAEAGVEPAATRSHIG